jgi:uncharacterized protein (UPF0335 family)
MADEDMEHPVIEDMGGNRGQDLNNRLDQYEATLDKIEKFKAEAKLIEEAAKQEGYDMKAFKQVEKLKRKGFAFIARQLTFETLRNTYLKAAGLPATVEDAMKKADEEAKLEPETKTEKKEKRRRGRMN